MKKITAILLVLLMVFAIQASALAAAGVGTDEPINGGSGETTVNVEVDTANLSVTVPLSMTIVANISGGDCAVPSNYAITNNSAIDVHVTSISVTTNGSLTLSDTEIADTTATNNNKVSIALTPAGGTLVQLTTAAITTGLDTAGFTMTAGQAKTIAITAKSGQLDSTADKTDAFTIIYVIAPVTP